MKLRVLTTFLLFGLAWSAPTSDEDFDNLTITTDFYPDSLIIYRGKHDIVNVLLPLNSMNFDEDDSSESNSNSNSNEQDTDLTIFFAEADIDKDGKRTYRGFYALKNRKAKKILDNGVDAASSGDDSKTVYIAATDGIYKYTTDKDVAEKYGSITDNVIGIAHEVEGDLMYILTDDHSVYKVTDKGDKKEKLDDVVDAQQILLDYSSNLYYLTSEKSVYVRSAGVVKKIEGLPADPSEITLIKPPIILENGIVCVTDGKGYIAYANGTIEDTGITVEDNAKPTSYAPESALIQYVAYNKNLYEYNILAMVLGTALEELKDYLSGKTETIQDMASQRRQLLRKKDD